MTTPFTIASLDVPTLSARLHALAGEERELQADFLLHLDALDRVRGYAQLGYPSLWEFLLRGLHLRESAAGRRIGAMRVLRRLPSLEPALRDGRLCMSTLCLLGPVLTEANAPELTARAAYLSKRETEELVATLRPGPAPAEGLRRLPRACGADPGGSALRPGPQLACAADVLGESSGEAVLPAAGVVPPTSPPVVHAQKVSGGSIETMAGSAAAAASRAPQPQAAALRPVAAERWSLRVSLEAGAKRDLEELTALLSHTHRTRDLGAVVKAALRCAVEKHRARKAGAVKRRRAARSAASPIRGSVAPPTPPCDGDGPLAAGAPSTAPAAVLVAAPSSPPETTSTPVPSVQVGEARTTRSSPRSAIQASVRREVWERDGGRCTYVAEDGTRCGSRWQVEFDHAKPVALGGESTAGNVRLRCRTHNVLHAEEAFGREHMRRFRRERLTTSDEAGRLLALSLLAAPRAVGPRNGTGHDDTGGEVRADLPRCHSRRE